MLIPFDDVPERLLGRVIVKCDRLLYVFEGEPGTQDTPIELHLDDGSIYLFESDANGTTLAVRSGEWNDPFAGELDPENAEYVRTHGKVERFSTEGVPYFGSLIGACIEHVIVLEDEVGCRTGLALETNVGSTWLINEADELHVYWAQPAHYRVVARHSGPV